IFMAVERAAEARVVALAIIGPVAGIVAEIDVVDGDGGSGIGRRIVGDLAGFIGGAAVGGVGEFVAVERAAEAGIVAFAVIGPIARIVAEINAVGRNAGIGGRRIGHFAGFVGGAAIGGVGHFMAGERAAETGVVAFAVIGERADIGAEIDLAFGHRRGVGDLAGFVSGAAIGGVGHLVGGQRATEAGIV